MGVRSPCGTVRYADRLPAAGHRFSSVRRSSSEAGPPRRASTSICSSSNSSPPRRSGSNAKCAGGSNRSRSTGKASATTSPTKNAKLDESLRDDRGTNTAALNDAADAAQERMRANREAYERDWPKPKPSAAGGSGPTSARELRPQGAGPRDRLLLAGRSGATCTASGGSRLSMRGGRRSRRPHHGKPRGRGDARVGGLRRRRLHARDGGARRPQFGLRHQRRGSRPPHGDDHLHLHPAVARPKPSTRPHPEAAASGESPLFARDARSASPHVVPIQRPEPPFAPPRSRKRFRCSP